MKTEYLGKTIESGFFVPGYWAKCAYNIRTKAGFRPIYEGGYRTEAQAISAVKRKLAKAMQGDLGRANNKSGA